MIRIVRTNSENSDFISLVRQLDIDLAKRDGDDHAFYHQYNKIDNIKYALLAYENDNPVGCGALREFDSNSMEVKRMYTLPESRGKGIASKILSELESWTTELGYRTCVLETGKRQPEAIKLYVKNGYRQVPNYGQYAEVENSLCFTKDLSKLGS